MTRVHTWPNLPDPDQPAGSHTAVIATLTEHPAAATALEHAGWQIRDCIRWHTGGQPTRYITLARRPLLTHRWEERIAPTVHAHGTGLLHLAPARVPGATPSSPTRWPPNLILQHHPNCRPPTTPPRWRVSAPAVRHCAEGCPILELASDPAQRSIANLAPHTWCDTETIVWINRLLRPAATRSVT